MMFVDTGAFVARYLPRDDHHASAAAAWVRLEKKTPRLFTSNFVLDETFTLLARRASYDFAAQRARSLLASKLLTVLRPDHAVELRAVELFEKYADQSVSFTDCVSFVLMKREGVSRAFAYDRHFRAAGFELWPAAARRGS